MRQLKLTSFSLTLAGLEPGKDRVLRPWIVPIPGTRKRHRLEENLGAASVELGDEELSEINDAAAKIQVQGGRYNEAAEQMTNL